MSGNDHNTHHREQSEHAAFNVFYEDSAKYFPDITPRQRHTLAAAMVEKYVTPMADNATLFEYGLPKERPELVRKAPTLHQAHAYLIERDAINTAPGRITAWRQIQHLDTDALLALVPPAAKLVDALATKPEAKDERTADQKARNLTVEDIELERRGYLIDDLLPSKRRELREEIARENARAPTPAVEAVKVRMSLGSRFAEIDPQTRVAAHREAVAAGKTLPDYGIDTAA